MEGSPAALPIPEAEPAGGPLAVIDIGASALKLIVAEPKEAGFEILEDLSRGVLLGRDTFTHGRLTAPSIEAALKALEGFRRILEGYGVVRYRAVATSAVREAQNRDAFIDRVRLKTGLQVEVIDGSEENRLTYMGVRDVLRDQPALIAGDTLLIEVGGGSADLSFLRHGEPIHSGTYPLGSIRMRQSLASWHGGHDQRMRLLHRHVRNVVDDLKREIPLGSATHYVALGGDVRFVAARLAGLEAGQKSASLPREDFLRFTEEIAGEDVDQLVEHYRLPQTEAETLVPALMAYRELLLETKATEVVILDVSLRLGVLIDMARQDQGHGIEDLSRQVLVSAWALGEKYRFDAPHARNVAHLATRLFDELFSEHGLSIRHRLLLQVAALLHDIGIYVNLRGHHKHSQYLLSVSDIFGLSREDMAIVGNVARYHRRALPQKSHVLYMGLDREQRVEVNKLAALLRLANALDADHLQKVSDVRVVREEGGRLVLEVEGAGDLTMERIASLARADFLNEAFAVRLGFREARIRE